MKRAKGAALLLLVALIVSFFAFDLDRYLTLEFFQAQREQILEYRQAHPLQSAALFLLAYVLLTGASIPGALVLTLAAGAIFGLALGTLLVSFASALGATLAFCISRFLLRDALMRRYGPRLKRINAGFEREGWAYLFALRLVPIFPFVLVNLAMGLTPIRAWTFYWVSQVAMLPGTLVYVNAGRELGQLTSLPGLASPSLLLALSLLAALPFVAKAILELLRRRRVYRGYQKPRRFDRNLIVIGAGAAGLVSAYTAATLRARVTLIEREQMGGDCLNTGCVPSKTLLHAARLAADLRQAPALGFPPINGTPDFGAVMARVRDAIRRIEPHDSPERYEGLGVECVKGEARLLDPWTVEVGGRRLTAQNIILATGAAPQLPPLPGLAEAEPLTSETVWQLQSLPRRLLVLGGGPVGCELAQAFARLGAEVTLVGRARRLLPREDAEFSARLEDRLRREGIRLELGAEATGVEHRPEGSHLRVERDGSPFVLPFDRLLVALGRRPRLQGYGLEDLGIVTDQGLEVNERLQTRFPHVYACGDVASPFQFTHVAAHTAWYASVNALLGPLLAFRGGRFRVDYSLIPWCTFTDPEIAHVGLNEQEARRRNQPYEVTTYNFADLDRAICEGEAEGLVKVLTVPGRDRILGVTIAGPHAGELIAAFVLAMRHGLGLNKILRTIHVYPTFSEANKAVAGAWQRAHAPEPLLRLLARFHARRLERTENRSSA